MGGGGGGELIAESLGGERGRGGKQTERGESEREEKNKKEAREGEKMENQSSFSFDRAICGDERRERKKEEEEGSLRLRFFASPSFLLEPPEKKGRNSNPDLRAPPHADSDFPFEGEGRMDQPLE